MMSIWSRFRGGDTGNLPASLRRHSSIRSRLKISAPLEETDFVVFDTELTGLDFRHDSIISLGAIRMRGAAIFPGQTFYRLIRPESELKGPAVLVHEITNSDLSEAETSTAALSEFVEFAGDAVLVGHFVYIDLNFLNRALRKSFGLRLRSPAVDTARLHDWLFENDSTFARHYQGMSLKTDLFSLAKHYDIHVGKAHNAFSDAFVTAQLFQRFLHFLPGCGIRTLKDLLSVGRS